MRAPEQTITVTPTPPEAQVRDANDLDAIGKSLADATNVNPGPIPDALREGEGDTAAPDNESVVVAIARLITPDVTAEMDRLTRENEQLSNRVDNQHELIEILKEERESTKERMAQIAAAEADGNAVIYIAPDCVPWLKATVHEAKHGYTTTQQYAAAVSIEAQCDAIAGA